MRHSLAIVLAGVFYRFDNSWLINIFAAYEQ